MKLLDAGLIELVRKVEIGGYIEKYYQACAHSFQVHQRIFPKTYDNKSVLLISGSHDMALGMLAEQLEEISGELLLLLEPIGSLDGLISLRNGLCDISGSHLFDADTESYNTSYVKRIFADRKMAVMKFAQRTQGLILGKGNPKGIKSLDDILREDVQIANRNRGSGTRIWLDHQLSTHHYESEHVKGYKTELSTHRAIAYAVMQGKADVGLGLLAAAQEYDLPFIPLMDEKFDLIFPEGESDDPVMDQLLDILTSANLRNRLSELPGYDFSELGKLEIIE
jgi:putative molybdopterin biosynthesis protein